MLIYSHTIMNYPKHLNLAKVIAEIKRLLPKRR